MAASAESQPRRSHRVRMPTMRYEARPSRRRKKNANPQLIIVGKNDWQGLEKRLGALCARNTHEDMRIPPTSESDSDEGDPITPQTPRVRRKIPPCWLIPASDTMALHIARQRARFARMGWKLLTSDANLVHSLSNKVALRQHAEKLGLSGILPHHYDGPSTATYPCILKYSKGAHGSGVSIVKEASELSAEIVASIGSSYVLQELIPGSVEFCTSIVAERGRIIFAVRTRYEYDSTEYVWPRVREIKTSRRSDVVDVHSPELELLQRLLEGYTGVGNFNYKVRSTGELALFEMNTRLGADMACDVPAHLLRSYVRLIVSLPSEPPTSDSECKQGRKFSKEIR